MNLLLITQEDEQHYVLIKDFNKLMYIKTKHRERKHFCMYCLQCFASESVLNNRKTNCVSINEAQAIKMPEKGDNILEFNNPHKQMTQAFVIYADFEVITEKMHICQPNDKKSFTEAYQNHTDCGYAYKLVCCYDNKFSKPLQLYRGENAVYKFMECMLHEVRWCKETIKRQFNKPLKMTNEDELNFKKATKCHICDKQYTAEDVKVRVHCHITGLNRGSAHNNCNLKLRIKPEEIKIPVIFHNLKDMTVTLLCNKLER